MIGSQQVPYIYEDRITKEDFLTALHKLYEMSSSERQELGLKAREWAQTQFSFDSFVERWDDILTGVYEKYGSWSTRKNYQSWNMMEIV